MKVEGLTPLSKGYESVRALAPTWVMVDRAAMLLERCGVIPKAKSLVTLLSDKVA